MSSTDKGVSVVWESQHGSFFYYAMNAEDWRVDQDTGRLRVTAGTTILAEFDRGAWKYACVGQITFAKAGDQTAP